MKIFSKISSLTSAKNNKLGIVLLLLLISLIYIFFSLNISKNIFLSTSYSYYTYLLTALFHGHLDIISPTTLDLSIFNNRLYLNWGPSPILFILPFYLFWGEHTSDILYTLVAGIANVFLFYFAVSEFKKLFELKFSHFVEIFIILSFAFCTPNFYMSLRGGIHLTEQIIATFYILTAFVFLLKFLNTKFSKFNFLILSIIFFNLAWLTRATMVFYGTFFLYVIYLLYNLGDKKMLMKSIIALACITFFFVGIFLTYNYLRFSNPLETGLNYHDANPRYKEVVASKKIFSIEYIPHNFTQFFLNPAFFSIEKPYVNINLEGNSIFSVYPVFILFLFLFQKKYLKNKKIVPFLLISFLIILMNLSLLMVYFATGWTQVGSRYALDIIPLVFLMTLFAIGGFPKFFLILVFIYGAIVNILGLFVYFNF